MEKDGEENRNIEIRLNSVILKTKKRRERIK